MMGSEDGNVPLVYVLKMSFCSKKSKTPLHNIKMVPYTSFCHFMVEFELVEYLTTVQLTFILGNVISFSIPDLWVMLEPPVHIYLQLFNF